MASICHAYTEFYVIEKHKCLSCFFRRFMAVFEGSNFFGPPGTCSQCKHVYEGFPLCSEPNRENILLTPQNFVSR